MQNYFRNFRLHWDFPYDGKFLDKIKTQNRWYIISGEITHFIEKSRAKYMHLIFFPAFQYANLLIKKF